MGIKGLLQLLDSSIKKDAKISSFKGKKAAIDIAFWLYRGTYNYAFDLFLGEGTTDYLNYSLKMISLLKKYGIKVVVVFDGLLLPIKLGNLEERRNYKEAKIKEGIELINKGEVDQGQLLIQQNYFVTGDMMHHLMDILNVINVEYIVSPYEADSQMAYMLENKLVDFAISDDSDIIAYGHGIIMFKIDIECNRCCYIDMDSAKKISSLKVQGSSGNISKQSKLLESNSKSKNLHNSQDQNDLSEKGSRKIGKNKKSNLNSEESFNFNDFSQSGNSIYNEKGKTKDRKKNSKRITKEKRKNDKKNAKSIKLDELSEMEIKVTTEINEKTVTEANESKMKYELSEQNNNLNQIACENEKFRWLTILLGCDYCQNIKGLGPSKLLNLISKIKNFEELKKEICEISKNQIIPNDYWKLFDLAEMQFKHGYAINPENNTLSNLSHQLVNIDHLRTEIGNSKDECFNETNIEKYRYGLLHTKTKLLRDRIPKETIVTILKRYTKGFKQSINFKIDEEIIEKLKEQNVEVTYKNLISTFKLTNNNEKEEDEEEEEKEEEKKEKNLEGIIIKNDNKTDSSNDHDNINSPISQQIISIIDNSNPENKEKVSDNKIDNGFKNDGNGEQIFTNSKSK